MEEILKAKSLLKKRKGQKTYKGHPSQEENLIILDSINMWKGKTIKSDEYGTQLVNRR